ncbi:hypothetical protein V5740_13190 [Croceibacterium sp. TMG7-5b_MA50]|uniref:hypothetical protein n=1 Tax=Croceibacterium sp. TMG7-5b_MA50 TaxID=3121290 RepID=UPI003221A55C
MSVVYVSPTGSGDRSGSSKANAAAIDSLNSIVIKAGEGGTVVLAADEGAYTTTRSLTITGSGVTITATNRDGTSGVAVFEGSRAENWTVGQANGNELFRIAAGADNLVLENMHFVNTGTAIRVIGDVENLTVRDMEADNVRRFFENLISGEEQTATISGLLIQNVDVSGFSKNAIRLQYDTNNVLIQNVRGDSERQDGDNFAMGVHLDDTVHDVVFQRVIMENAIQTRDATEYWNGDGFSAERGTYNIYFRDTVARGNADGGYDIKSSHVVFDNALSEGNGRNYRLWGDDIVMRDSTGRDPEKIGGTTSQGQVWVGAGGDVTIINSQFEDAGTSTIVFNNEGGALHLIDTEVELAEGARLTSGPVTGLSERDVDRMPPAGSSSYEPSPAPDGGEGLLPSLVGLLEDVLGEGRSVTNLLEGLSHDLLASTGSSRNFEFSTNRDVSWADDPDALAGYLQDTGSAQTGHATETWASDQDIATPADLAGIDVQFMASPDLPDLPASAFLLNSGEGAYYNPGQGNVEDGFSFLIA